MTLFNTNVSSRHNELDLPSITSPLMYQQIAARKSVPALYESKLIVSITTLSLLVFSELCLTFAFIQAEEVLTEQNIASVRESYKSHLETELAKLDGYVPTASMLQDQWSGMVWPASEAAERDPPTGVKADILEKVGRASVAVPDGFVSLPFHYRAIARNEADIDQKKLASDHSSEA
jgi:probable 2-oxoglutarate dehydrogenase E1 component DHKTD1